MTSVSINQTNRFIFYSLNTDDINYAIKTLIVCMYVCTVCQSSYGPLRHVSDFGVAGDDEPSLGSQCGKEEFRHSSGRLQAAVERNALAHFDM